MPILDRQSLNLKVVEAVQLCGWNVLYLVAPTSSPFNIRIFNQDTAENLKIYIWNLTQGGKNRSEDEYRIQPKVRNGFEQVHGYKTLVLGWWDDVNVFAGFDVRLHRNPRWSSSIQIRRETLERAVINGISAHDKGNKEIAVAFRPDLLIDYAQNIDDLHAFGESTMDLQVFESVIAEGTDEEVAVNQALLNRASQQRRTIIATLRKKVRAASFKRRVLTAYEHQCTFCSLQLKLVDAAHIIPVKHETSTDETSNGMALCPLHHRAYDNALITINARYQILHNKAKMEHLRQIGHDGQMDRFLRDLRPMIHVPPALRDRPHVNYVKEANKLRGWTQQTL